MHCTVQLVQLLLRGVTHSLVGVVSVLSSSGVSVSLWCQDCDSVSFHHVIRCGCVSEENFQFYLTIIIVIKSMFVLKVLKKLFVYIHKT